MTSSMTARCGPLWLSQPPPPDLQSAQPPITAPPPSFARSPPESTSSFDHGHGLEPRHLERHAGGVHDVDDLAHVLVRLGHLLGERLGRAAEHFDALRPQLDVDVPPLGLAQRRLAAEHPPGAVTA